MISHTTRVMNTMHSLTVPTSVKSRAILHGWIGPFPVAVTLTRKMEKLEVSGSNLMATILEYTRRCYEYNVCICRVYIHQ